MKIVPFLLVPAFHTITSKAMLKSAQDRPSPCPNFLRVSGVLADPFESCRGLGQGDGLSCALFNIALEVIVQRAGIDTKKTILTKSVQLLGFDDNNDIIARNFATEGNLHPTESRSHADGTGHEYDESKIHDRKGVENWSPFCLTPLTVDVDELEK